MLGHSGRQQQSESAGAGRGGRRWHAQGCASTSAGSGAAEGGRAGPCCAAPMRAEALSLYRQCLRSARRCPEEGHRQTMWRYVQMSFRDNMTLSDPRHVRRKLNAAASELADMNSLHDMRQAPIPHHCAPAA